MATKKRKERKKVEQVDSRRDSLPLLRRLRFLRQYCNVFSSRPSSRHRAFAVAFPLKPALAAPAHRPALLASTIQSAQDAFVRIDEEHAGHLVHRGYVVVPGFLSAAEL